MRIIENSQNTDDIFDSEYCSDILSGIKEAFSLINEGHMAVAVGKRGPIGERWLWLFRNQHRPLWIVDCREYLGQIFFISEPNIWEESIKEFGLIKGFPKSQKLIEIPENQIWCFQTDEKQNHIRKVNKYEIQKGEMKPWQYDGKHFKIKSYSSNFNIISELNECEQYEKAEEIEVMSNFRLDLLNKKCDEIIDVVNNIRQYCEQLTQENSISKNEFEELLADLECKRKELEDMSVIINR